MQEKTKEQFLREKKDFLSKPDKSRKGSIDEKIKALIDIINDFEDFYTTSSCSGRIMIYKPGKKKVDTKWYFVSHDEIRPEDIKKYMGNHVWLKVEGPILHISCFNFEKARWILNLFRNNGWKKTGIISLYPKIIVEASTPLAISTPFKDVGDEFIETVVQETNEKLKRGWELIKRVYDILKEEKNKEIQNIYK